MEVCRLSVVLCLVWFALVCLLLPCLSCPSCSVKVLLYPCLAMPMPMTMPMLAMPMPMAKKAHVDSKAKVTQAST